MRHPEIKRSDHLAAVCVLNALYMVFEAVGGWLSGSLSLLADAGHMLSDVLALLLAWGAGRIARWPANPRYSFGYQRAEVLAAFVSGLLLVGVAVGIVAEAVGRFPHAHLPSTGLMMVVALGGLFVNGASLALLHKDRQANLNLRAVWLHMLGDTLGSVVVLVAGAVVWATHWHWVDPLASVLLSLLIAGYAWPLIRDAVYVLMESAPARTDLDSVRCDVSRVDGVVNCAQLRVWSISSGVAAANVRVVVEEGCDTQRLGRDVEQLLMHQYDIRYVTVQLEFPPRGEGRCG
ncbi:MAG: cation diffusion facilitator family transporter [Myxococcota bacterium]